MPKINKKMKTNITRAIKMNEVKRQRKNDGLPDRDVKVYNEATLPEDAWLSCQTDVNKLVQPNEIDYEFTEEKFIPLNCIYETEIADEKYTLPNAPNESISKGFIPEIYTNNVLGEKVEMDNIDKKDFIKVEYEEWVIEESLCRCCHAEGSFTSLETSHAGSTYTDMLAICFNMQLFPVRAAARAALGAACALCMARLRDALAFSRQVRACEARFQELYYNNCIKVADNEVSVKEVEIKLESTYSNCDAVEMNAEKSLLDGRPLVKQKVKKKKMASKRRNYRIKKEQIKNKEEPVTPKSILEQALQSASEKKRIQHTQFTIRVGDGFKCTQCDTVSRTRDSLRKHFKVKHLNIKYFKCTHCPKTLNTTTQLINHKLEEHNIDGRAVCNACDKTYNTQHQLKLHIKSYHMMGDKIKCTECDYETYNKCLLAKHVVRHKKTKDFHCGYCKKSFSRKKTLQYHERIHTGDKRKSCKECGQAFVQKASLNYHMAKYHPGVKF